MNTALWLSVIWGASYVAIYFILKRQVMLINAEYPELGSPQDQWEARGGMDFLGWALIALVGTMGPLGVLISLTGFLWVKR